MPKQINSYCNKCLHWSKISNHFHKDKFKDNTNQWQYIWGTTNIDYIYTVVDKQF